MNEVEDKAQLAALMAEMAWMRRLARALLKGIDGADDLVQDTWLAASGTTTPSDRRALRPWLARVAINLVRSERRSQTRRTAREHASVEAVDPVRTPEDLLQRVEVQRRVADEVVRLDEPYRSTILLHYFEELTSAEIARRLDVPEGTVRRRLKVALDQLRDRLGANDPKKARNLIIALAPLGAAGDAKAASAGATFLGVIAMKKLIAALVILVLLIIAAVWWRHSNESGTANRAKTVAKASDTAQRGSVAVRGGDDKRVPSWFARAADQRLIAGRVTFQGKPVANAVVELHDELSKAGVRPALERRSNADGRFDFGLQLPAPYDVVASAAGKTAAIVHIEVADPTLKPPAHQLELSLGACAASVSGTVFDASGGTIAHARVRREGLAGAETDEKGAFELCLPRGNSPVTFVADGYGAVILTVEAYGAIRQDVVLVPEAVVTGRVVEDGSDRPISGVYVYAIMKGWGRDRVSEGHALTAEDGRFRIGGLLPGRYRMTGFADGVVAEPVEIVANVGANNPEITLSMKAMARVSGRVVSAGEPVGGARVIATLDSSPRRSDIVFSQADGSFVMHLVPVGQVSFSAPPYGVVTPVRIETKAGKEHSGVIVEVERLATIKGRVTRLGVPVAGARVCCASMFGGADRVTSRVDGSYEMLGVAAGTHRIGADSEEVGAMMDTIAVTVAAGEERTEDLEMDLAATISGVVVDQHDQPVRGVFVKWTNEKTGDLGRSTTDAQGRYRCTAMTGGAPYRASVFATSYEQAPYRTADGKPYPVIELADGKAVVDGARVRIEVRDFAISGRVIDAAGEPVADAEVKAMAMPAGGQPIFNVWLKLPLTVTDRDGAFKLFGLTQGTYALWARSPDGGEGTTTNVTAGSTSTTVKVERPGSIDGKLVDYPAAPGVYAAMIGVRDVNVAASDITATSFRIAGLRPGRYVVTAQTGYEGASQVVELKSGERKSLTLRAQGRGAIDGTVLDFRTRAPIAGAACHASASADGFHAWTNWDIRTAPKSNNQGRVVLDPALAGSVRVRCIMPIRRWSPPSADVLVPQGGRATVQLMSAELLLDYPSTTGIDFDGEVTAPRITAVQPDSTGGKAGLLVGDLVIAVDGKSMAGLNGEGVRHIIDSRASGADVSITVLRGAQRKTFNLKTQPRQL